MPLIAFPPEPEALSLTAKIPSSANVVKVTRHSDDTNIFLKGPPGADGDDMLLREWVGTRIADQLDIPTLQYGVMEIPDQTNFSLYDGQLLRRGPVFASIEEQGVAWEGDDRELDAVVNREAFAQLIVLDTLTRNYDRYGLPRKIDGVRHQNHGNVFLSLNPQRINHLLAIDHTHSLGAPDVLEHGANHPSALDGFVYGNFPGFEQRMERESMAACLDRLSQISGDDFESIAASTPTQWGMTEARAAAIGGFLHARAQCTIRILRAKYL